MRNGIRGLSLTCCHCSVQCIANLFELKECYLQFARLESLLQQAARSPGRQTWQASGTEQIRAATGAVFADLPGTHVFRLILAISWVH